MNKKAILSALLTAVLYTITNPALAQGDSWYVAGGLGASLANDSDNTQAGITITSEFDTGVLGTVAIGHTFGGLRAEGEIAYIQNDISTLKLSGVGGVSASGDVSVAALMANVYYDIDTGSKWKPFIGAGAGYANVSINNLSSLGVAIADDSAGAFAYQFKAGIGYAFTDTLDGTLGYRYFSTADADFVDTGGAPFTSDGLQTNVIEVGVRYRF